MQAANCNIGYFESKQNRLNNINNICALMMMFGFQYILAC